MATSGEAFVGRWKIVKWNPPPHQSHQSQELPDWLVQEGTDLHIREKEGHYEVQWKDRNRGDCTIVPPLRFLDGQLVGGDSHVRITNDPSFRPPVTPEVAFEADTDLQKLIVSLVGRIGDGDPGTFTAEGPPRPEPEG